VAYYYLQHKIQTLLLSCLLPSLPSENGPLQLDMAPHSSFPVPWPQHLGVAVSLSLCCVLPPRLQPQEKEALGLGFLIGNAMLGVKVAKNPGAWH
jgi:hypothetical protein